MNIEMSKKQFRRLLDMVYIGNWILNSARGDDRFGDYDDVESLLFSYCAAAGMPNLAEILCDEVVPSKAFIEGGIHEAIMDYEDSIFYDILAEELARRDMALENVSPDDNEDLMYRMENYITEFEAHGMENLKVEN
ncbi:MAG: hypothetical protein IJP23_04485 [Oscillospiraceae bacterium]|nr:hypothetical protein [Oscillospiraceae bacterium]